MSQGKWWLLKGAEDMLEQGKMPEQQSVEMTWQVLGD